jgi:hypothetical protein
VGRARTQALCSFVAQDTLTSRFRRKDPWRRSGLASDGKRQLLMVPGMDEGEPLCAQPSPYSHKGDHAVDGMSGRRGRVYFRCPRTMIPFPDCCSEVRPRLGGP